VENLLLNDVKMRNRN